MVNDPFLQKLAAEEQELENRVADLRTQLGLAEAGLGELTAARAVYTRMMGGPADLPKRRVPATTYSTTIQRKSTRSKSTRIKIGDAAVTVLENHGGPMRTGDLTLRLQADGRVKLTGPNASNTVSKTLSRDDRFYNPSPKKGVWDLVQRRKKPGLFSNGANSRVGALDEGAISGVSRR